MPTKCFDLRIRESHSKLMLVDSIFTFRHALKVWGRSFFRTRKHFKIAGDLRESFEAYLVRLQDRLWNEKFIQGSTGHFQQLWVRDLGLFSREYIEAGYSVRLLQSLDFALQSFQRSGRITTTVWPNGQAYNIFGFPSDSLPMILWSFHKLSAGSHIEKYRGFLEQQSKVYREICLGPDGFTKRDLDLCGLKDAVQRPGSLYLFCMNFLFDQMQERWALGKRVHSDEEWVNEMRKRYWSEDGFFDEDIQRDSVLSSDAQLIPFWLELLPLDRYWDQVWASIESSELSKPLLIRQTSRRSLQKERWLSRLPAPNYQGDTIWANLAAMALCLAFRSGRDFRHALDMWADLSFRDGELMELYDLDLKPYRSFFYRADQGMNWSIGFLSALRRLQSSFPPDAPDFDD